VIIRAYGLFWRVDEVDWNPGSGKRFRMLGHIGTNQPGVRVADFREQRGLYILYGNYGAHYVGLTRKQDIGKRLRDHLDDQHAGRWDRFSWFGFRQVLKAKDADGLQRLRDMPSLQVGSPNDAIGDMEALLIKALGLPPNVKQMKFRYGQCWEQVRAHEVDWYMPS
jgi:hypothetical protein